VTSTSSPQMNMPSHTGAESGTPNTDGSYTFTVQVEDATGQFAQHTYTQVIGCAPLAISTKTLPNGTQNQAYGFQEVATGGFGTLTWTGSSFPSGISISLTGSVSGTTANFGSFTPHIVVTDSCPTPQSVSIQPTLTIAQQIGTLAIQTPTTFPQAVEGQPFQLQMSASGGLTPYNWALIGGAFPPGFALMTAGGSISGTATQSGAFSPVIQVTDAQPASISNTFHLTVVCPPFSVPIANPMPAAQQGVLYSGYQVPTSGGIAPFAFGASGITRGAYDQCQHWSHHRNAVRQRPILAFRDRDRFLSAGGHAGHGEHHAASQHADACDRDLESRARPDQSAVFADLERPGRNPAL
jgi:hypothetical protein